MRGRRCGRLPGGWAVRGRGRGSCCGGRGFPAGVWWCLRRCGEGSGCDAGFFLFLDVGVEKSGVILGFFGLPVSAEICRSRNCFCTGRRILPGMRCVPGSSCKDMEVFHI